MVLEVAQLPDCVHKVWAFVTVSTVQEGPSIQYLRFLAPKSIIQQVWILEPETLNIGCLEPWELMVRLPIGDTSVHSGKSQHVLRTKGSLES